MERVKPRLMLVSLLAALAAYFLPLGIEGSPRIMLFIMVFVASLWISESAPLHATALFAALLLVTVAGLRPGDVFAQYFDPVIVLLLGGFVIAVAMSKYRLDEYIAYNIISRAGSSPKMVVLALISASTFVSLWISNSATAALMMPIALVLLARNRVKRGASKFGKACVLAVGYGATIGGIGLIIGSTPNIIAAKFLNDSGMPFGFFDWLWRGLPYTVALMLIGWAVLITIFKPEKMDVVSVHKPVKLARSQKKVIAVFAVTIALWVTEGLHGISSGVVALVPVILFYFSGMLGSRDFMKVDWPTLMLVGGGLALGMGIHTTQLDAALASAMSGLTGGQGILGLFLILGILGVMLTVFVSNTTAAAVYLPIVVALASSFGGGVTNTVMVAAIGVSLDFMFPFGTPPTAIAYGTKYVNTRDIAKAGLAISLLGVLLLAFIGMLW